MASKSHMFPCRISVPITQVEADRLRVESRRLNVPMALLARKALLYGGAEARKDILRRQKRGEM